MPIKLTAAQGCRGPLTIPRRKHLINGLPLEKRNQSWRNSTRSNQTIDRIQHLQTTLCYWDCANHKWLGIGEKSNDSLRFSSFWEDASDQTISKQNRCILKQPCEAVEHGISTFS